MHDTFTPMWRPVHSVALELGFKARKLLALVECGALPLRVERFGKGFYVETASLERYRASLAVRPVAEFA